MANIVTTAQTHTFESYTHPQHLGNKTKKVVLRKPATAIAAPYYPLQNPPYYMRQTSYSFQIENFPPH